MTRKEVLAEGVELYLGDCREILPTLGKVDAVVTDPPYGIGEAGDNQIKKQPWRNNLAPSRDYGFSSWDAAPIEPKLLGNIIASARWTILFGGNYYEVPPSSCWLVWDKLNTGDYADCELAWTNLTKSVKRIQYRWNGMIRANNEPRGDHPTQKPVGVMKWCIEQLPTDCAVILDPFMGSGTTGVASVHLGRQFVGIELEPRYFDAACRRIDDATKQQDLFIEKPKPVKQEAFEL